jgi:hypothetical protein
MDAELSQTGSIEDCGTHRRAAVPFAQRTGAKEDFRHLLRDLVSLRDSSFSDALPTVSQFGKLIPNTLEPPRIIYITEWLLAELAFTTRDVPRPKECLLSKSFRVEAFSQNGSVWRPILVWQGLKSFLHWSLVRQSGTQGNVAYK